MDPKETKYIELYNLIMQEPSSRERSIAITELETSFLWLFGRRLQTEPNPS